MKLDKRKIEKVGSFIMLVAFSLVVAFLVINSIKP